VAKLFGPARRRDGDWDIFVSASNPWELTIMATKQGDKSVGVKLVARRGSGPATGRIDCTSASVLAAGAWRHLGPQTGMRVENSYWRNEQARQWFNEVAEQLGQTGAGPIKTTEYVKIILAAMSLIDSGSNEGQTSISVAQLMQFDQPPEEWLIEGMVQKGVVNVLVANGGGFKTTLGCAMAIAVGSGREHSEADVVVPTCQQRVYYYTAEDKAIDLHARIRMLLMGRDADVVVCDGITDEWSLFNRIRAEEEDRTQEYFRIIDSVSAIFGDLNDNAKIVAFARGLRLTLGTTLLDAHQSKGSIATGRGDPMGGIQWRNQARHVLHMATPDPGDGIAGNRIRVVTIEKHNGGLASVGDSTMIKLNVEPGKTMWFGQAEGQTARATLCAGIVSGHRQALDLYSWAEDEHGITKAAARRAKQRLLATGQFVQVQGLLYLKYEAEAMMLLGSDD